GCDVKAATVTLAGLVIDGFTGRGVSLENSNGNVIRACYIGVDPSGSRAKPNGSEGIFLTNSSSNTVGGPAAGDGNLISGNKGDGIHVLFGGGSSDKQFGHKTHG